MIMWRGLYIAGSGMITETNRTDVIANNLSNANTTGYKRDVAVSSEFEPMLLRRVDDQNDKTDVTSFKGFSVNGNAPVVGELGMGSYTDEIATNHEQGALHATGNPFDLAISGAGYFAVQTAQGVRYTRNGNFYKQSNGRLVTVNGQSVLNQQGQPIVIPNNAANVQFGSRGQVYADGRLIGTLQFVQFDNRRAVLKQGDSLYYPQDGAQPQPATGTIEQGMLEASNVNVVSDMVELINNYRMYEAGSKAVTTQDAMVDKAVNEVGKV
jgi:flagellar basal-body rod protein FlgG